MNRGRVNLLMITLMILGFIGVSMGLFAFYGEMAMSHGRYSSQAENVSRPVEHMLNSSMSLAETTRLRTGDLEATGVGAFTSVVRGGIGAVKGFLSLIGILFYVIPAITTVLYMPEWVGWLINAVVIFTVTYLIIAFLMGRQQV